MKWKQKTTGDTRIKTRFLLFPKCINGIYRWLEIASFEQSYDGCKYDIDFWFIDTYLGGWKNTQWVDIKILNKCNKCKGRGYLTWTEEIKN